MTIPNIIVKHVSAVVIPAFTLLEHLSNLVIIKPDKVLQIILAHPAIAGIKLLIQQQCIMLQFSQELPDLYGLKVEQGFEFHSEY